MGTAGPPPRPFAGDFFADERIRFLFLVLFSAAIFFAKLGLNGMANYDDCFHAEEAKEILKTGHWGVLTYNYHYSFHHAPLFIWLVALSFKLFGITVYAAKFPSALMGFLTVLLVYFLGRKLFDPLRGFFAGFILSTTYIFFKYGRHSMLDVTQAFFVTLAMAALVLALGKDRKFFWLWGLGIALAILTKSAFGLFPLIVTFLFLGLTRRWKILVNPHFWGGLAVIAAVTGAWIWTQYSAGGQDFINVHFKFIIMGKVTGGEPQRWTEYFGFLKDLATYYWPWLPFAVYGLFLLARKDLQDKDTSILLLLWSLTVLVIMSFMRTRFPWYLMQSMPALALVSAYALGRVARWERVRLRLSKILLGICLAVTLLLNILPFPLDRDREKDTRILSPYVKAFADKGAKVIALREDYWGLNNALLFFSDHAAEPLFQRPVEMAGLFQSKDLVVCLAHRGDLPEINKELKVWYPVKYAEDLILISNQRLDVSDIKTW